MEVLQLDVRTLAFVSGLGGFIMAATMAGIQLAGTRQPGLLQWMIGGLVFGAGYLMGHLLLTLPGIMPGWMAGALANALIGMGHLLILLGVQRYLLRKPAWWVLSIPVAMFVITVFVPAVRQGPDVIMVSHSTLFIVATAFAGFSLWRATANELTAYRRTAAAVLLGFSLFFMVRLGYFLASHAITTSFSANSFQLLTFVVSMLFGFLLTMALVIMVFREKELRMRTLARRDALTGLHNRYSLTELSAHEYRLSQRYARPLSLIAMDLDHFKTVNDLHGHAAGDLLLQGVASVLTLGLRDADLVFRVGGEEFLMLLPFTEEAEAVQVAERLRAQIEQCRWAFAEVQLQITASFGVAEVDPDAEDWEQAMGRVDRALYQAKESGRNRLCRALPAALEARAAKRKAGAWTASLHESAYTFELHD